MCIEEECFSQKKFFTNRLNMSFLQSAWVKKTVEENWLSGKRKGSGHSG